MLAREMVAQELAQDLAHTLRMTFTLGGPLVLLSDGQGSLFVGLTGGAAVLFTGGIAESGNPVTGGA